MTTNDDNDNADIGDDGKDSLPPPMMVTRAEMTMGMMGGGCTRPLGQPQGDTQGSTEACAELRLQVLQGSHRSNGCDTKNGNWKL
jgi:hypothetical protein